jgi:hypothetical protein
MIHRELIMYFVLNEINKVFLYTLLAALIKYMNEISFWVRRLLGSLPHIYTICLDCKNLRVAFHCAHKNM